MKVLYVSTISDTINAFLVSHIKYLIDEGHNVDIACNIDAELQPCLDEWGCRIFNIEFSRSPLSRSNIVAYQKLKTLIRNEGYDLVHTHTPVASACVRLACRNLKDVKVCYTAHGFHFYGGAPLKNWLVYYPIERYLSRFTDVLITINKEDYDRARKSFRAGRAEYVPGVGLNTSELRDVVVDKASKRKEIGVPEDAFVLLSVGELNRNKNHEVIIKAVSKLDNKNIRYVICGKGPLEKYLRDMIRELRLEKLVRLLGFRTDIPEILKTADVFVFPSYREGLPVALMEAMATGLPVVCSRIRGCVDLIDDGKGGFLVEPNDVGGFVTAIKKVIDNGESINGEMNKHTIEVYTLDKVVEMMKSIYSRFEYS